MCKKILDSVSMLQQVVEMLPEAASAEERMVAVDPGLQSLNEALIKLQEQAKFSVGFQRLQVLKPICTNVQEGLDHPARSLDRWLPINSLN